MNKKQLIYFLKTAELKSIAAAARALDIAQPGISQQIANLEHLLGTNLFERNFRGVRLTESGEQFRPHAEAILRMMERAKKDIQRSVEQPTGTIRVGMTQPIGNLLAVPLIAELNKAYPGIELDLYTGLSYQLVEQLKSNTVDIILSSPDGADVSGFRQEKLFSEQIFLIAGTTSSDPQVRSLLNHTEISFEQLSQYKVMVTGQQDSLGYLLRQHEQQRGICLDHQPPYGQLMTTLRYVTEGLGLMIAPSSAYYHLLPQKQIHEIEIKAPELYRDVFLSTLSEQPVSNLQTAVREQLIRVIGDAYRRGDWKGILAL